jgi:predicted metallopeptidase
MTRHPLVLRWQEPHNPLPVRVIQARKRRTLWFAQTSHADNGHLAGQAFDFCVHIQQLVMDIAVRCPDFAHLQVPRILVSVTQARGQHTHGLQARVTPLRFAKGALVRKRRGVPYHIQRFFLGEHEYLYLMTFCLPRFLDQDFDQKLVTLFHELYHIGPAFDGDLRRHDGRYHFHSHSQRDYDKRMVAYAREYLASKPDASIHAFLRYDFSQLQERHGAVTGIVVPRPKMIPLLGQTAT